MRMSVVVEDKTICIDGDCCSDCNLEFIDKNIHAIQWYKNCGEIEYVDEKMNEKINSCIYFDELLSSFEERKRQIEDDKNLQEEKEKEQERLDKEFEIMDKKRIEKEINEENERIEKQNLLNQKLLEEEEIKLKNEAEEIKQKQILEQEEERKKQEEIENEIKQKMLKEQEEYENNRDYEKEFRSIRNDLLLYSDWTQLDNSPLSEEKKVEWEQYRQTLRDLPQNFEDFESAVKDKNHPIWPQNPEKNINGEVNFE
jgi:hypothetical protein